MRIALSNAQKSRRLTGEDNPFDLSRWRWFAEGCVGCIGMLKDWLVDAVAATLVQKGTILTEDILTRTMPHPARRVSLEMEARAGEHKAARHNSEGAKQFQALLKKPVKAANGRLNRHLETYLGCCMLTKQTRSPSPPLRLYHATSVSQAHSTSRGAVCIRT